ncbi:MAG: DUF554 domain-containing protein [Oscillospiraceae bacterium]|nr:DUF554 domain-containing protein [Oscillospiraceae bacterium]
MIVIRITASLINAAAVILGGGIGVLFKGRIPEKVTQNIPRAIGLCVCVIGVSGAMKGDVMLLVVSLALGAFIGEVLNIDGGLNKLGMWLQKKLSRGSEGSRFSEGFVAATLMFCVGAMTIVGSIDSGLRNDNSIILTKSVLDGVSAMFFASFYGFGVLFAAVVIVIYQGGIEFFAGYMQNILTDALITQISAVGSVMILGIGLNMSLNAKIKVANLLPGLLFAAGYYYLFLK